MKLRSLLIITAAMYVTNGCTALLAPAAQLTLYGVSRDPGTTYMAQWAGLGSVAVGLVAWFGRNVSDHAAQRAFTVALLIYYVIAGVVSALGTLAGIMNAAGWLLLLVNVVFAAGYASVAFRAQRSGGPRPT